MKREHRSALPQRRTNLAVFWTDLLFDFSRFEFERIIPLQEPIY